MFERDYIKRLIKQFAEVVEKIIHYRSQRDWQQVQMIIDVCVKQLLGLNPDLIEKLSAEEIVKLFTFNTEPDYEKCLIVAVLQNEQANVYANTNKSENEIFNTYLKSFILFTYAFQNKELKTGRDLERAHQCCDNLLLYELNDDILLKIFKFYKNEFAFAKAEDVLFLLLKKNRTQAKETAVSFYKSLLEYDDADLERGNLPRDEVLDGLKNIQNN